MGPKEKEPLLDPTGAPQALVTEEDVEGEGIEADNEAIDADDLDKPDDEPDPG